MTYNFKPKRRHCPFCEKLVAVDRKNRLKTHNFRSTGKKCIPKKEYHETDFNGGNTKSSYTYLRDNHSDQDLLKKGKYV